MAMRFSPLDGLHYGLESNRATIPTAPVGRRRSLTANIDNGRCRARRSRLRCYVPMYLGTMVMSRQGALMIEVERVQTGIRIEKRLLKVLKALAELKDLSVGDLLEGLVLHAFEGKTAFSKETLAQIAELKKIYRLTLRAGDSHQLKERP
jgi:hypothetical protein